MSKTIRIAVTGALALALVGIGAVASTPAAAEREAAGLTVTAVHEESGELAEVTVTNRAGEKVEDVEVVEKWRGNADTEDGLYAEDPAPDTPMADTVNVSIELDANGEVVSVELTDAEGNDVPVGSIAESHADDNTDEEN